MATRSPALRTVVMLALLGTAVAVVFAVADRSRSLDSLGGWVAQSPGQGGVLLPADELDGPPGATGGGHDGRYFYAVARSLPDLVEAGPYLDRPAYRSQRILYPALARLLHPWGTGPGLVWTMFVVGALGVLLSGAATGSLSLLLRGPAWPALVPPLFYGSWVSLRISVPDPLGCGLAVLAMVLSLRSRHRWAILAAVAAVLTRETTLVPLIGLAVWRRDRAGLALVGGPVVAAGAWNLLLRTLPFPPTAAGAVEDTFTAPLVGVVDSLRWWFGPDGEGLGALSVLPVLALGVVTLVRRSPSHPMWWPTAASLALVSLLNLTVLGPERNGSRMVLLLLATSVVALATPQAPSRASLLGAPAAPVPTPVPTG